MAEAVVQKLKPPFRLGTKQVFLCKDVVTFLRTPRLPPRFATFRVPLTFTKLDIRDYLWNLYGVAVGKVRSRVQEQAVRRKAFSSHPYRPRSKKYMTVELARSFVWPEVPEKLDEWHHTIWMGREKTQLRMEKRNLDEALSEVPPRDPRHSNPSAMARTAARYRHAEGSTWSNGALSGPAWLAGFAGVGRAKVVEKAAKKGASSP